MVEKCSVRGVLTNFSEKVPFWGPYILLKHFRTYLPYQGASFNQPDDHILSVDFLTKKVENWSKLKNFVKSF